MADAQLRLANASAIYGARLELAKLQLKKVGCTHPPQAWREYNWEHDNGYGRQHMCTGIRCDLCGAEDAYKRCVQGYDGAWYVPEYLS